MIKNINVVNVIDNKILENIFDVIKVNKIAFVSSKGEIPKTAEVIDVNPLQNIANTQKVHAVILNGRALQRKELDKALEELKFNQR